MPGTVSVACNLPHGLILQLHDMVPHDEPMMGGGYKTVNVARPKGGRVVIKGNSHPAERGPAYQIIGGYALTHGVDADFFAAWLKQNADHDAVKGIDGRQPLVFAFDKPQMAEGRSKELAGNKNGMEGIDPTKLKGPIQTAERI